MARIEQSELARRSGVSVDTVKRLERTEGPISANVATVDAVVSALAAAGMEFTNGGQPGVRVTPLWRLHRVAERAQVDEVLKLKGRDAYWTIAQTTTGLERKNQHGKIMGRVAAGTPNNPAPKFDPELGRPLPERATPGDLQRCVAEMLRRDSARGPAAPGFDPPARSE